MLEHLTEITAVTQLPQGRTSEEMLRFILMPSPTACRGIFRAEHSSQGAAVSERQPVGRRLPGHRVYELDPSTCRAPYRNPGLAIVGGVVKPNLYVRAFRGTSIDYRSHEPRPLGGAGTTECQSGCIWCSSRLRSHYAGG